MRQVRRHGREHECDVAPHVGDQRSGDFAGGLGAINLVHQFHDGRDAGVEVPAALEVVAHALDGLVELALKVASFG